MLGIKNGVNNCLCCDTGNKIKIGRTNKREKVQENQSHYRPGVAQRVPGS